MGLLTYIKDRLRSKLIPYGGTLSTPFDDDQHPIAIANEILGGLHGYRTLEELAAVPVQRLNPPMAAIVREHIRPDGTIFVRSFLVFDPSESDWNDLQSFDSISVIPGYDLSKYWKIEGQSNLNTDLQVQYAPEVDYGAVSGPGAPAFQPPIISSSNYQLGRKSDADPTIIWSNVYDVLIHKYMRQRFGNNGQWGIPVKILGENYVQGGYVDNRFIWVDKNTTPTQPRSLVNGVPNNEPAGWQGTPDVPGGIDYYDYIVAHDLFQISATKDAFQQLKSEWSVPVKISTDPQLVRYGSNPTSTNFIGPSGEDTADWRGYFTPNQDTHMAKRETALSPWRIENIAGEEGEYTDFIFKAFDVHYEPTDADRPTIANPFSELPGDYPNNDWKDFPFVVPQDKVLYRSMAKKFNNGELKTGWSIPTRNDGQDVIQVVIEPTTATIFKYDAAGNATPSTVQLVAKFYRGADLVTLPHAIKWYKGVYDEDNEIIKGSSVGVSQHHTISGDNDEILTLTPDAVNGLQLYTARVFFSDEDYYDNITVIDVADSQGFLAVIESNDGFVYKNATGSKTFTAKLFGNGELVNPALSTFQWFRGVTDITPASNKQEVTVSAADFTDKEVLKVVITHEGNAHVRTETIVDVQDGKATIWQYSNVNSVPNGDTVWSTDPTGAWYARISVDGGTTWGTAFKIRGENAPYNGGFYRRVFKNSATQPTASGVTSTLFPDPATGWTDVPTARAVGEHTWQTDALFLKNPATSDTTLNSANWTIQGTWGAVVRITGIDGNLTGPIGPIGKTGWSPILALVDRGADKVIQVVNWTNNDGAAVETKPSTGYYLGAAGYVTDIAQAINVKGATGPAGALATGGSKSKYQNIIANSISSTDDFSQSYDRTYPFVSSGESPGVSFVTPTESNWAVYVEMSIYIQGDDSSVDTPTLTIERANGAFSTVWNEVASSRITTLAGSFTLASVFLIDRNVTPGDTFKYRLRVAQTVGSQGRTKFSKNFAYKMFLVPK